MSRDEEIYYYACNHKCEEMNPDKIEPPLTNEEWKKYYTYVSEIEKMRKEAEEKGEKFTLSVIDSL